MGVSQKKNTGKLWDRNTTGELRQDLSALRELVASFYFKSSCVSPAAQIISANQMMELQHLQTW